MNHLLCLIVGVGFCSIALAGPIVVQAEKGELHDLQIATDRAGFQGDGYVTGFKNETGELVLTFDAPAAGIYDLSIRYGAPKGGKGYNLTIDGTGNDGFFPESPDAFSDFDAGKVELKAGSNSLKIGKSWGHYDVDSFTLTPSKPFDVPRPIAPTLCDPHATPEALSLMKTLCDHYGQSTFTGVIKDGDRDYVRETAGVAPMIMGGDLIDYSPSRIAHGSDPKNETERLIRAAHEGHIIALCWHWNAPRDLIDNEHFTHPDGKVSNEAWYFGFYTHASSFDFSQGIDDPKSETYQLLIRDIDAIAEQLKKTRDAKVPVLWRPLHESDGGWFWWGARGPENFKKLWRLMHDRLVNVHHLDNLIWVYTWNNPDWYPGDDVVDIVGLDLYPANVNDTCTTKWSQAQKQFDGRKLIALSEFGGVPNLPAMQRLGVRWSYFASWTGNVGPRKNEKDDLKRIYTDPAASNLKP